MLVRDTAYVGYIIPYNTVPYCTVHFYLSQRVTQIKSLVYKCVYYIYMKRINYILIGIHVIKQYIVKQFIKQYKSILIPIQPSKDSLNANLVVKYFF